MKCELCGKEHDGSYGSGRFCSDHCRRVYSGKRVNINGKHKCNFNSNNSKRPRAPYGTWKCQRCNMIFETRRKLQAHNKVFHSNQIWNKGQTKEINASIAKGVIARQKRFASGELIGSFKGKHHILESKNKISVSMKKAHAEGRANTFASSRYSCDKSSYPEKWFMSVIKNEFNDQNYIKEYPFGKYSLDFAWPHKKICIEIDGSLHYDQRFPDRIQHDINRDIFIKSKGWKILRLRWTYVLKQKKYWIRIAKEFIDGIS